MNCAELSKALREFCAQSDAERAARGLPPLVIVSATQQPRLTSYVHMPERRQAEHRQHPQQESPQIVHVDYLTKLPS